MPQAVVGVAPSKTASKHTDININKGICASQPEQGAKVITALTKLLDQQEEMSEFV